MASLCVLVPLPPLALIAIDRSDTQIPINKNNIAITKTVSQEDGELASVKFGIPLFTTKIKDNKFSNADIYPFIAAARPSKLGNEKA